MPFMLVVPYFVSCSILHVLKRPRAVFYDRSELPYGREVTPTKASDSDPKLAFFFQYPLRIVRQPKNAIAEAWNGRRDCRFREYDENDHSHSHRTMVSFWVKAGENSMAKTSGKIFRNWKSALLYLLVFETFILGGLWIWLDFGLQGLTLVGTLILIAWGYSAFTDDSMADRSGLGAISGGGCAPGTGGRSIDLSQPSEKH